MPQQRMSAPGRSSSGDSLGEGSLSAMFFYNMYRHRAEHGLIKPPMRSRVMCDRDTTADSLRALFSPYGELEDVVVTTDRATGKSKGYGFVTFRYATSANAAVAEPEKQLDVSTLEISAHMLSMNLFPPVVLV